MEEQQHHPATPAGSMTTPLDMQNRPPPEYLHPQPPHHHSFPAYPTPYRGFVAMPDPSYPGSGDYNSSIRQMHEMQDMIAGLRHENHMLHQENYSLSAQVQGLLDYQHQRQQVKQSVPLKESSTNTLADQATEVTLFSIREQIDAALKDWMPLLEQSLKETHTSSTH
jgi:hypothetical protein